MSVMSVIQCNYFIVADLMRFAKCSSCVFCDMQFGMVVACEAWNIILEWGDMCAPGCSIYRSANATGNAAACGWRQLTPLNVGGVYGAAVCVKYAHVATSLLLRLNIQTGTTLITPTSHCALIFSRRTGSCIELHKRHCSATYNTGAARIFTRKQCPALRQQHLKQKPPLPLQFE